MLREVLMHLQPPALSPFGSHSAEPSPVNRMMAAFAADFRDGIDINLGVGYVNEHTIPADLIREALAAVLANPQKYRLALNYGGPAGSDNLRQSIRRFYLEHRAGGLDEEILGRNEVLIGPNGATSLLDGIAQVLAPGIVVTSDPMYYIYCNCLQRRGFEIVALPEDAEGIDAGRVEHFLGRLGPRRAEIRFFYLVTVNNPTCRILSNPRRQHLVQIASRLSRELGRAVPVFFDTAYELLIHDPQVERPQSALTFDELGIVYEIGTLSKILAPALRIGYLIGRDGPLLRALVQKTSDAGFSAPLVTQEIASYLLDHHAAAQVARVNQGYRQKALATRQWIATQLGPWLADCSGGQAGFYFYLTFAEVQTHERSPLFRYLARTTGCEAIDGPPHARKPRVVYLPGEFCVHPNGQLVAAGRRQLRLSYGYEELPRIEQAIGLVAEAVKAASDKHGPAGSG